MMSSVSDISFQLMLLLTLYAIYVLDISAVHSGGFACA